MEVLEKWSAKFQTEGAGKKQRDAEIRFEQLLLKEQQKKEREDLEREQKRENDRRQRDIDALRDNKLILERRAKDAERDRVEGMSFLLPQ
jgi:hypothetical protein